MVFGAEALKELGIRLGGELIVNTVSEEEPPARADSSRHHGAR